MKKREKYIRTKEDIRQNNRVLRIAKSTSRVFVIFTDRKYKGGGEGGVHFVKNSRSYNPFFDIPEHRDNEEFGKTLEELISEGYNLKFAGYHGDGKDAYWNNTWWNHLDLVVQSRLLERG